MKFNGYEPTLHALTAKHYPQQNGLLSRDTWELWWRAMSDQERQAEYDELMAREHKECPICNCSNGHSLTCATLGVVPVLDLQVTRTIEAR